MELLTLDEMCMILKMSRGKLLRRIHAGEIPRPFMLGSQRRWVRAEIDEWLDSKRGGTNAEQTDS